MEMLKKIKIPVPTLETQQKIVEQAEEEMKIVDTNNRLIEIFEKKIKDKIDEVWGINNEESFNNG